MKESEGGERSFAHVEQVPIRWGDMDAMGHVNNTVYFRYMEQARIGWFDRLLPQDPAWQAIGLVLVNAACHYRRPMIYPGTVNVKLFIGRVGGSSVATYYDLHLGEDAAPHATGEAVVVFVGAATQKPVRIPETIRRAMAATMGRS